MYDAEVRVSGRRDDEGGRDVSWHTRLPIGFEFLISRESGRPIQPAFDYLSRTYVKGRRVLRLVGSARSVDAAARDLCDFHDFLDHAGQTVADINELTLEDYLESMISVPSRATGRPYSPRTISRRRSTVWNFVGYCQAGGLIKHRFLTTTIRTPRGSSDLIAADISGPQVGPMDEHVRCLHPMVVIAQFDSCGPPAVEVAADGSIVPTGILSRRRLMPETCVQTGIRREESCELSKAAIMACDVNGRDPFTTVAVPVVGKGNKRRPVPFPVWLIERLQAYVREVRDPAVTQAIETGYLTQDHGRLFVLDDGMDHILGRKVLPAQFGREFHAAKNRLLERLRKSDEMEDAVLAERVLRSRLCIHALRHTFALLTYMKRREAGDPDPSKYVQAVLGHVFRHTTEAIYLNASHIYEAELSDAYAEMLRKAIKGMAALKPARTGSAGGETANG